MQPFVLVIMARKNRRKRTERKKRIRIAIYLLCLLFFGLFVVINAPFLYHRDLPEPFGFFSDNSSANSGQKYDKCELSSIDNSLSDTVSFFFGFVEEGRTKGSDEYIYMYYGNCGHVVEFSNALLDNSIPDYLIEFPFSIQRIGRTCRKKLYLRGDKNPETIELDELPASHYNNADNNLIVEWSDPLSACEFQFLSSRIYKKISFDKLSINYSISDRWMYSPGLVNNQPESFVIKLRIPAKYEIEGLENIEKFEKQEGYILIETDLKQSRNLHLIIIDKNMNMLKHVVTGIFTFFVLGIILDTIIKIYRQD